MTTSAPGPRPAPHTHSDTLSATAGWRDQLVELHVLAEHGDTDAADTARRWIATDDAARRMWDDVERLRDQLNAHRP